MGWSEDLLKEKLAGKLIGHHLYCFGEIGFTNDEAYRLGLGGAPEGTAILADSQSKGKGRMQRVWHSPAGANIYTSIILRPPLKTEAAPQISLMAGVAVAELLEQYSPGKVALKWPNDVLLNEKKVCGILAQMKTRGEEVDFVVVGIGLNVNIHRHEFPAEINNFATSLSAETGRKMAREELIISLYENLAKWYTKLINYGFEPIKAKWLSLAPMIGQTIELVNFKETVTGKALGIDETGALMLLTAKGGMISVSAGDATIVKKG